MARQDQKIRKRVKALNDAIGLKNRLSRDGIRHHGGTAISENQAGLSFKLGRGFGFRYSFATLPTQALLPIAPFDRNTTYSCTDYEQTLDAEQIPQNEEPGSPYSDAPQLVSTINNEPHLAGCSGIAVAAGNQGFRAREALVH